MRRCLGIFRASVENSQLSMPAAPEKMIRKWGKQLKKKGHVNPAHSSAGRNPKLSDEHVQTLVGELLGWRKAGLTAPYPSIKRFCYDNPVAKKICNEAGVGEKTILRRLKAVVPSLGHARLRVKGKLTAKQKQQRVKACRRLLRVPMKDLEWVVWVDAKTLYVNITHRHGWIDKATANHEELVLEHKLAGKRSSKTIQLKYYAAVNAKVGTVSLIFITGTTGLKANSGPVHFKVRQSAIIYNHPRSPTIPSLIAGSEDCSLCSLQPFAIPRGDANHPPALCHSSNIQCCIQSNSLCHASIIHGLVSVLCAIQLNQYSPHSNQPYICGMPPEAQDCRFFLYPQPLQHMAFHSILAQECHLIQHPIKDPLMTAASGPLPSTDSAI